jgi:hypothetical protein
VRWRMLKTRKRGWPSPAVPLGAKAVPVEATEVLVAAMAVPLEAMAVLVEAMAVLVAAMAVPSEAMVAVLVAAMAVPSEAVVAVLMAAMAVLSEAMVAVLVEATAGTPDPELLASSSAPLLIFQDPNKTKYSFKLLYKLLLIFRSKKGSWELVMEAEDSFTFDSQDRQIIYLIHCKVTFF